MFRIGLLHHGSSSSPALARFRTGLLRHALVDGANCLVDALGAEGRWHRLPALTAQLLQRKPDVLVAIGALAALSAQRATSSIPILHAIVLDPVDIGLAAPNVTGVSSFDPEQPARHLSLLQQLLPGLRKVAFLADVEAPQGCDGRSPLVTHLLQAASQLDLDLHGVALSSVEGNLEQPFDTLKLTGSQALVALEVPTVLARLPDIMTLADRHRLPTLSPYGWRASGLVMEGTSLHDALDPLAESVALVSRGTPVGAVPMRIVRHQRLVVRMDRARRIGLTIPTAVLQRASLCVDETSDDATDQRTRIDPPGGSPGW
ncbi:MAG: ABC transporter substrate-binding protein [Betaproteobacteria bacterium]